MLVASRNGTRSALGRMSQRLGPHRGTEPLMRKLDAWLRPADAHLIEQTVGEVSFQLDTRDLIDFRICYFGAYDTHVARFLERELGPDDRVLWDIGANIGAVSLPLLAARPRTRVHAFEASPPVIARLRDNVGRNPALNDRITVHHLAVTEQSGDCEFFVSAEDHNSGVGAIGKMCNTVAEPVVVTGRSAADILAQGLAPRPDVVKIDVEGFEREVLAGMRPLLEDSSPLTLVFEHEPYRFAERSLPPDSVVEVLSGAGFDLFRLGPGGEVEPYSAANLTSHQDFVARKAPRS